MRVWSDREDFYRERGIRLRKIGERHGEEVGDEHKPKFQKPEASTYYELPIAQKKIVASEFKEDLKKKATKSEKVFRAELFKRNIQHIFQFALYDENHFAIADFYIQKLHLVVEIDGGYHNNPTQKKRDWHKDNFCKKEKLNVLRIKNEDVVTFDYNMLYEWYQMGGIEKKYEKVLSIVGRRLIEKPKKVKPRRSKPQKQRNNKKKTPKKRRLHDNKVTHEGQPCPKCGDSVVRKKTKGASRKKRQKYGFKYYFLCNRCKAMFMDEASKFWFKNSI